MSHEWDDDACCVHCGFDGAEWWHGKHRTYEGRASNETMPLCDRAPQQDSAPEKALRINGWI